MHEPKHLTQQRERCDVGAPSEMQTAVRSVHPDDGDTTCTVIALEDGSGLMQVRLSATDCQAILPGVELRRLESRNPLATQLESARLADALSSLAEAWTVANGGD